MKKQIIAALFVVSSFGLMFPQLSTEAAQPMQTTQQVTARINIEEAKTAALQEVHGKIINIGLENEGNALVYDVDIQKSSYIYEVSVDANSGKILDVKKQMNKRR